MLERRFDVSNLPFYDGGADGGKTCLVHLLHIHCLLGEQARKPTIELKRVAEGDKLKRSVEGGKLKRLVEGGKLVVHVQFVLFLMKIVIIATNKINFRQVN